MKPSLILLLGLFLTLLLSTHCISHRHDEAAAPQANTKKGSSDPAKPENTKAQGSNASPALPTVKLCSVNKLSTVPGSPIHTFSVLNIQPKTYQNSDFDVTWEEQKVKKHRFFKYIGKNANFGKAFPKMKCQKTDKKGFGKVCNYPDSQVQQYYNNAFGEDTVYKCTVPQNSFTINTRFVLQLSDFPTSAGGRWSVFAGLYHFKSQKDANKKIERAARQINSKIASTNLNTFDINSNLNIIPDFVKGTLSWIFTSNINSTYVQEIQTDTEYDLSDVGYVKILPAGTEFIIGGIYNGTTQVQQICDNYRFNDIKDDCGLTL